MYLYLCITRSFPRSCSATAWGRMERLWISGGDERNTSTSGTRLLPQPLQCFCTYNDVYSISARPVPSTYRYVSGPSIRAETPLFHPREMQWEMGWGEWDEVNGMRWTGWVQRPSSSSCMTDLSHLISSWSTWRDGIKSSIWWWAFIATNNINLRFWKEECEVRTSTDGILWSASLHGSSSRVPVL